MINHPMLMQRDPPPILDVTRPALPKRVNWPSLIHVAVDYVKPGGDKSVTMLYTVDNGVVIQVAQVCESAHAAAEQAPVAADSDGWIDWKGGKCPVPLNARVDVMCRSGFRSVNSQFAADSWERSHFGVSGDIIAYKVLP